MKHWQAMRLSVACTAVIVGLGWLTSCEKFTPLPYYPNGKGALPGPGAHPPPLVNPPGNNDNNPPTDRTANPPADDPRTTPNDPPGTGTDDPPSNDPVTPIDTGDTGDDDPGTTGVDTPDPPDDPIPPAECVVAGMEPLEFDMQLSPLQVGGWNIHEDGMVESVDVDDGEWHQKVVIVLETGDKITVRVKLPGNRLIGLAPGMEAHVIAGIAPFMFTSQYIAIYAGPSVSLRYFQYDGLFTMAGMFDCDGEQPCPAALQDVVSCVETAQCGDWAHTGTVVTAGTDYPSATLTPGQSETVGTLEFLLAEGRIAASSGCKEEFPSWVRAAILAVDP